MFEDKRKSRIKRVFLLFSLLFLVAFIISYYINNGYEIKEDESLSKVNKNLIIPNSVKNYEKPINEDEFLYKVKESTQFCYLTYFKMCGHKIEKSISAPDSYIGLSIEELKHRIEGWEVSEIKDDNIFMIKEIDTFCPNHFIIGVKDDNIAIYIYNENGEKILKEKTDININILTPEDQVFLTSGIVADTEDDMEQKLEGFSN